MVYFGHDISFDTKRGSAYGRAGEKTGHVSLRQGEKISAFYEDQDHKKQWMVQLTDMETGDIRDVKADIKMD